MIELHRTCFFYPEITKVFQYIESELQYLHPNLYWYWPFIKNQLLCYLNVGYLGDISFFNHSNPRPLSKGYINPILNERLLLLTQAALTTPPPSWISELYIYSPDDGLTLFQPQDTNAPWINALTNFESRSYFILSNSPDSVNSPCASTTFHSIEQLANELHLFNKQLYRLTNLSIDCDYLVFYLLISSWDEYQKLCASSPKPKPWSVAIAYENLFDVSSIAVNIYCRLHSALSIETVHSSGLMPFYSYDTQFFGRSPFLPDLFSFSEYASYNHIRVYSSPSYLRFHRLLPPFPLPCTPVRTICLCRSSILILDTVSSHFLSSQQLAQVDILTSALLSLPPSSVCVSLRPHPRYGIGQQGSLILNRIPSVSLNTDSTLNDALSASYFVVVFAPGSSWTDVLSGNNNHLILISPNSQDRIIKKSYPSRCSLIETPLELKALLQSPNSVIP